MQETDPPLFVAFSNWYGLLWPPRKISGCASLAPIKHFFHKAPPFGERKSKWIQRGDPYEKSVFQELRKRTLIFCMVVIGTRLSKIFETFNIRSDSNFSDIQNSRFEKVPRYERHIWTYSNPNFEYLEYLEYIQVSV
jgi:hypothetical protein